AAAAIQSVITQPWRRLCRPIKSVLALASPKSSVRVPSTFGTSRSRLAFLRRDSASLATASTLSTERAVPATRLPRAVSTPVEPPAPNVDGDVRVGLKPGTNNGRPALYAIEPYSPALTTTSRANASFAILSADSTAYPDSFNMYLSTPIATALALSAS